MREEATGDMARKLDLLSDLWVERAALKDREEARIRNSQYGTKFYNEAAIMVSV